MMEKQGFRARVRAIPKKYKLLVALLLITLLMTPICILAYQANFAKDKKAPRSAQKTSESKAKGSKEDQKVPVATPRLERFSKDRISAKIDQAQKGGQITPGQANALAKKLVEIEKFVSSNKSKSATDQNSLVGEKRRELTNWAKDNDIPLRFVAGWL